MKKKIGFPWRIVLWFFAKQILLAAICLGVLDGMILLWLYGRADLAPEVLSTVRDILLWSLLWSAVVMMGVSLVMVRQLVIPLGRVIRKAQRIRSAPFEEEEVTQESLENDEPGEWYDLERAVNDLGRDLQSKTIRLSREKTELRAIMSAINEGVLAIDQERHPLFFNSQFALIFGLEGMDTANMSLGEILRSPDILQACEECLKDGRSTKIEAQIEPKELGPRFFQVSIAPLRKRHNQEIYAAVAVFHDITELKRAEQMRIEFVGNVSHELRTPLTSVKGYLQTVIGDLASGRAQQSLEFLKVVERNVERLMQLVEDLLDLSTLQSGVELKRQSIDLQHLTGSVLSQVDNRDHEVRAHFDVSHLTADEHRVEQVLRNLLQNAIRYVPQGGIIEISWRRAPAGHVVLSVKDNGPGIAEKYQTRLFERFYRIDDARSRQVGGTGIGLALVKHIMHRHGGDVRVVSEVGRGAEFLCDFPSH